MAGENGLKNGPIENGPIQWYCKGKAEGKGEGEGKGKGEGEGVGECLDLIKKY